MECPPIFLSENCSPPSDSLMDLINLCGGKVMNIKNQMSLFLLLNNVKLGGDYELYGAH